MTTNRVTFGQNGYWICSCGHHMLYLDQPESGKPRRMECVNHECPAFEIKFLEPTFPVKACL